jgi:hypothetical protein
LKKIAWRKIKKHYKKENMAIPFTRFKKKIYIATAIPLVVEEILFLYIA